MLTVIRSQAELGLIVAPGHPATRHLDAVIDTVTQAAEITKSLLTFSRLMPTEKRRLRLAELVADAQKLLRHVLPARIELRSQVDPECRSDILADRTQLYQVLLNLAINARDAMPQGGTLELGLAGGVIPEGGPSPLPAGTRCVRLWIADSGTGIDPAILPRVFEPFFTTKSREEGTGLGLSLVHGIVAQHGGHIEVDSRVGRGTRFTITFPALIAEPAPAGQAGRACGEGESILLAGADTFQTGTIGGYLQSIGYRVFLADGENQVLSILEQHPGQVRLVVLQSDLGPRGALACLARCREKAGPLQAILLPGEGEVRQEQAGDDTLVLEGPITIAEIARMVQKTLTPAGADTP
jgi:hypothetical protein